MPVWTTPKTRGEERLNDVWPPLDSGNLVSPSKKIRRSSDEYDEQEAGMAADRSQDWMLVLPPFS